MTIVNYDYYELCRMLYHTSMCVILHSWCFLGHICQFFSHETTDEAPAEIEFLRHVRVPLCLLITSTNTPTDNSNR